MASISGFGCIGSSSFYVGGAREICSITEQVILGSGKRKRVVLSDIAVDTSLENAIIVIEVANL